MYPLTKVYLLSSSKQKSANIELDLNNIELTVTNQLVVIFKS